MNVSEKKFVSLSYELYVEGEDSTPELMETATKDRPLKFTFGVGTMLEKFEENLKGLTVGDEFDFIIPAKEAYGEYKESNVLDLDKKLFEVDGEIDSDVVFLGNVVPMIDSEGRRLSGTVLEISDNVVVMDFNHPLAGETLHFKGEVLEVRDATEEEIEAANIQQCSPYDCDGCKCGCG